MKYSVFSLLLFTTVFFYGQVSIDGNAPSYKGKYVSLIQIEDYITNTYKNLGRQKVDSLGKFSFKLESDKAFKAIIEIEDKSSILYIDPKTKSYKINIPSGKNTAGSKVKLVFENLPDNDLNALVLEYNLRADHFMFGDSMYVLKCIKSNNFKEYSAQLDKFKDSLIQYYKPIKNKYFHNYIRYSIASLEQISTGKEIVTNRINVFNNYINNKPILYNNDAYMDFINQFYENTLKLPVKGGKDKLYLAINNHASLAMLNDIFINDVFLKDAKLRELIMIKGLGEEYYYDNFIKENILNLIKEIGNTSLFPENRIIAKNTFTLLTHLQIGYRAPNFSLIDSKGDSISLDSFKGKHVYLGFWASWNESSLLEMEIAQKLYQDYEKYITFVSVSMDKDENAYLHYIKEHPEFKWHIAHYNGDIGLITDYRLKNLPEYFLIDPDGIILQAPAFKPSPNGDYQSIDLTFFEIKKKLEPKKVRVIGVRD
ncbi:MAG: TlpA disulfide reductase family protein [Flavobacteriales bacterium]|nr:TlpA disulfide reductase family protein [Flavobacteriales bacterium]